MVFKILSNLFLIFQFGGKDNLLKDLFHKVHFLIDVILNSTEINNNINK